MTNNICAVNYKRELILLGLKFKGPISASLLGDLLPTMINIPNDHEYFLKMNKGQNGWGIWYETNRLGLQVVDDEVKERREYLFHTFRREYNMADALASYLILLVNSGTITADQCNEKLNR